MLWNKFKSTWGRDFNGPGVIKHYRSSTINGECDQFRCHFNHFGAHSYAVALLSLQKILEDEL